MKIEYTNFTPCHLASNMASFGIDILCMSNNAVEIRFCDKIWKQSCVKATKYAVLVQVSMSFVKNTNRCGDWCFAGKALCFRFC